MMLEKWEHVASDKSLVALVDSGQESDVMLTVQSVTVSGRPNPTPHPHPASPTLASFRGTVWWKLKVESSKDVSKYQ